MAEIYAVGVPCKRGHTRGRYASNKCCVQCSIDAAIARNKKHPEKAKVVITKWRAENRDKKNAIERQRYAANPEKRKVVVAKWRAANLAKRNDAAVKWKAENPAKIKAIAKKWQSANRAYSTAKQRERELKKMHRTPRWLDADERWLMREFYDLAARRTKMLGFPWHVDHVVPLQGDGVSGLHVPWNLQVIPGVENAKKGNHFHG